MNRRTILMLAAPLLFWLQLTALATETTTSSPATQSSEIAALTRKIVALEQQDARQLQAVLDLTTKVDLLLAKPTNVKPPPTRVRTVRVIPAQGNQPQQEVPGTVEYRGDTMIFTADENAEYSGPQVVSFRREAYTDKSPVPLDSVPEWELSQRIGGRHVLEPQTGVPVYALSEYIVRRYGKAKVIECVRLYGRPVPVGAVFHGDMGGSGNGNARRPPPTYNYNFGGPQSQ